MSLLEVLELLLLLAALVQVAEWLQLLAAFLGGNKVLSGRGGPLPPSRGRAHTAGPRFA